MSIKNIIAILGLSMCMSNSFILFVTFLYAFTNGGYICITINTYNEALLELIIIPIAIVMGTYGLIKYIKED